MLERAPLFKALRPDPTLFCPVRANVFVVIGPRALPWAKM
jgi:hypothetical protein